MTKKNIPALTVESLENQKNLIYLCLLEYRHVNYLCIVDNITPSEIKAYVLDYAEQEDISLNEFLSIATRWFYESSNKFPLSVSIAKNGLTDKISSMYRTFDTTYVSRIVGKTFVYEQINKSKVRRRRVVPLPEGIEVRIKK